MKPRRLTHLQILRGHDPEAEERFDLDFWLSVVPELRIRATLEAMNDYWRIKGISPQRLRRVLRVIKRGAGAGKHARTSSESGGPPG